jgi:hypothetical protein
MEFSEGTAAETLATETWAQKKLARINSQIDSVVDSIANGFRSEALKSRLETLEAEKSTIERQLSAQPPSPLRLHPKLPAVYRAKVDKLSTALADPAIRDEAAEIIRSLIDVVSVAPSQEGIDVEVRGEISKLIRLADQKTEQNQCSVKVVAGAGFEPTTFRL